MSMIFPVAPGATFKPMHRAGPVTNPANLPAGIVAPPTLSRLGPDQTVAPAAPPTAIQMQIKALITEQAQSRDTETVDPEAKPLFPQAPTDDPSDV